MLEELLKYDTEIFQYLNSLGNTSWDGFWLIVTHKLTAIPLYAILLFLVYKNYGLKGTIVVIVCVALLITSTDQISNLFKHGFKRPRPCQLEDLKPSIRHIAKNCGRYGYFSAHAASSMAAAIFLSLSLRKRYKIIPFILIPWAIVVGYSRIYLGVHYPLDVLTGMIVGGILGFLYYRLTMWGQNRFNPNWTFQ